MTSGSCQTSTSATYSRQVRVTGVRHVLLGWGLTNSPARSLYALGIDEALCEEQAEMVVGRGGYCDGEGGSS